MQVQYAGQLQFPVGLVTLFREYTDYLLFAQVNMAVDNSHCQYYCTKEKEYMVLRQLSMVK